MHNQHASVHQKIAVQILQHSVGSTGLKVNREAVHGETVMKISKTLIRRGWRVESGDGTTLLLIVRLWCCGNHLPCTVLTAMLKCACTACTNLQRLVNTVTHQWPGAANVIKCLPLCLTSMLRAEYHGCQIISTCCQPACTLPDAKRNCLYSV